MASYEYRSTGNNGENTCEGVDNETLIVFDKDNYTEVSSSEWSFLFSLGTGDGFQLENTSSFDVSVSSVQDQGDIFNGDKAGYRWEHTYIDYSANKEPENPDESLPERKNLKTLTFYSSDSTVVEELINDPLHSGTGGSEPGLAADGTSQTKQNDEPRDEPAAEDSEKTDHNLVNLTIPKNTTGFGSWFLFDMTRRDILEGIPILRPGKVETKSPLGWTHFKQTGTVRK